MSIPAVPIEHIHPDPLNVRKHLDGIPELTDAIKAVGLLQPLVVRPRTAGGYTIVDGHRRYHAALAAGLIALPCLVTRVGRKGEGTELFVMLAAAMHQRLTPAEQAEAFGRLTRRGLTPADIAARTGYSERTVRDRLLLLQLPESVRTMHREGNLSTRDATDLARQVAAKGTGATTTVIRRKHFHAAHPLYATVRATCTAEHRAERSIVGYAGCGPCWEAAIRDDEARRLADAEEAS